MAKETWTEDRMCLYCRLVKSLRTFSRGSGKNSGICEECAKVENLKWDEEQGWQPKP